MTGKTGTGKFGYSNMGIQGSKLIYSDQRLVSMVSLDAGTQDLSGNSIINVAVLWQNLGGIVTDSWGFNNPTRWA